MVTHEATPDRATRYRNVKPRTEYEEVTERANAVLDKYEEVFWRQPNVHEFGVSLIEGEDGIYTGEMGIVVYVAERVPDEDLPPEDRIPRVLEGILVQIIEKPAGEILR